MLVLRMVTWRACVSHWGVPQLGGIRPLPPLLLSPTPYTLYHLERVSACHSPSHGNTNAHLITDAHTHFLMFTHIVLHECSIYLNRCVQTFSSLAHVHTTTTTCTFNLKDIWLQGRRSGGTWLLWMSPHPISLFPPFFSPFYSGFNRSPASLFNYIKHMSRGS